MEIRFTEVYGVAMGAELFGEVLISAFDFLVKREVGRMAIGVRVHAYIVSCWIEVLV